MGMPNMSELFRDVYGFDDVFHDVSVLIESSQECCEVSHGVIVSSVVAWKTLLGTWAYLLPLGWVFGGTPGSAVVQEVCAGRVPC